MNRTVVSSIASFIMASALVGAQATTPPPTTPATPGGTRTEPAVPQDPARAAVVITDKDKDKDMMLTGCLVQGSGPTVFLLENAKTMAQGSSETGKTFIVAKAMTSSDVDFARNVNHKVSISGSAEDLTVISATAPVTVEKESPDAGKTSVKVGVDKTDEKMLPKLSARSLVSIGDTCTP